MAKGLIEPRVLKGFRDTLPATAIARARMIRTLENVFFSFGFAPIDTPALEYAEILLGKGSTETDRQLYRFQDQGGRDVALRFDLTVPLARFVAEHANDLPMPFRRSHIAPVWRAEKPQRGRYREFIQCDFDIIGTKSLLADGEVLSLVYSSLSALGIDHELRVNNRLVLNGLLESLNAGDKAGAVLRTIDKLDKLGKDAVVAELREACGFDDGAISRVFDFVALAAGRENAAAVFGELETLLAGSERGKAGVTALRSVFRAAHSLGVPEAKLQLDLSIARGLDYYTGTVFETRMTDLPAIGSICSGGRYDNLVGVYSSRTLPGVGGSIGLDRIFGALEELGKIGSRSTTADVFVAIMDESCVEGAAAIARTLRESNIAAELSLEPGSLGAQLKYADRKGVRFAVIFGENERATGTCAIKDLSSGVQQNGIALEAVAGALRSMLSTVV